MGKHYEHLSQAERRRIERLLNTGKSRHRIATIMGRSISLVSTEIKKGKTKGLYTEDLLRCKGTNA